MWSKTHVPILREQPIRCADLESKYSDNNQCTDYEVHPPPMLPFPPDSI